MCAIKAQSVSGTDGCIEPPYFLKWNLLVLTNKNPPTQAPELGRKKD
jgi:hypothetical protein